MDELVERVAWAIAEVLAKRHGGGRTAQGWMGEARREEARAIIPIVQADQRERDAAIADGWMQNSMLSGDCDTEIQQRAGQNISAAIRNQEPTDGR